MMGKLPNAYRKKEAEKELDMCFNIFIPDTLYIYIDKDKQL